MPTYRPKVLLVENCIFFSCELWQVLPKFIYSFSMVNYSSLITKYLIYNYFYLFTLKAPIYRTPHYSAKQLSELIYQILGLRASKLTYKGDLKVYFENCQHSQTRT